MMRSFLLPILAAACMVAGFRTASAQPPGQAAAAPMQKQYPELQEAWQFLFNQNQAECVRRLEAAVRKYPELPSAHVLMYQEFANEGKPNTARYELEEAVRAEPGDPEPFIILGIIAMNEREQRTAEAALDFERARRLLAVYARTVRKPVLEQQLLAGRAQLAEEQQDWKEAETLLRALLKAAPDDFIVLQRLAASLFRQAKVQEARAVVKEARKFQRSWQRGLTVRDIMGPYYDSPEQAGVAEELFKESLEKAPDDLAARVNAADWGLRNGRIAFVKEQAEAALRIEAAGARLTGRNAAGSKVGRMLRGVAALWEKDWLEAEHDFEKVYLESPSDFGARNGIALALVEQDDPAKKQRALDYAEANCRVDRSNQYALSTLCWVHFRRNEFDQAASALEEAVKDGGGKLNNFDTVAYAAYIFHQRHRDWEAKTMLEAILKSGRSFSMKPEAEKLYQVVKDARKPETGSH
jgi:cytochrome c-type biogenesis protein CcmH/NrfG